MTSGGISSDDGIEPLPTPCPSRGSAEAALKMLVPSCSQAVLHRFRQERIHTVADLASLDKDDLRDLGLCMADRSRILRWCREASDLAMPQFGMSSSGSWPLVSAPTESGLGERKVSADAYPGPFSRALTAENGKLTREQTLSEAIVVEIANAELIAARAAVAEAAARKRLEEIEQQADFWCNLASCWTAKAPLAARCKKALEAADLRDIRENLLESLFDLSPDRVREVFDKMCASGTPEGKVTARELALGLQMSGLPEPDAKALNELLEAVVTDPDAGLQHAEFESILSRLVLAQLLACLEGGVFIGQSKGDENVLGLGGAGDLTVCDYNSRAAVVSHVSRSQLRSFFFGHRSRPKSGDLPLVRWVHLRGFDLPLLLALTVKYSLHPLAVEDTIQMSNSKTDRYGHHYFVTIQRLCLVERDPKTNPVTVSGHHVALFCAGPPLLDTVVTVGQQDNSFEEDWPGGCGVRLARDSSDDSWADKIRRRLQAPISRLRERRADFLVHAVLDTCTDELSMVVKAYAMRLSTLETMLRELTTAMPRDRLDEVALARLQLAFVMRRLKGLQRVVRRIADDKELSVTLSSYLQDILEHMEEALEDSSRLVEKCSAIEDAYEHSLEREQDWRRQKYAEQYRHQEIRRSMQADRQNNILFALTIVTTIFAPVQFIAGVYGMNFQDESGKPTIPELLWTNGYCYFWGLVVAYLTVATVLAAWLFRCLKPRAHAADDHSQDPSPSPASADIELPETWLLANDQSRREKKKNMWLPLRGGSSASFSPAAPGAGLAMSSRPSDTPHSRAPPV